MESLTIEQAAQIRVIEFLERISCPACVNNNLRIELAKLKENIKIKAI